MADVRELVRELVRDHHEHLVLRERTDEGVADNHAAGPPKPDT